MRLKISFLMGTLLRLRCYAASRVSRLDGVLGKIVTNLKFV